MRRWSTDACCGGIRWSPSVTERHDASRSSSERTTARARSSGVASTSCRGPDRGSGRFSREANRTHASRSRGRTRACRAARSRPDFGGDYAFWYPCVALAERHAKHAPVYFYRFDVAPRLMRWAGLDATHGLELFALFEQTDEPLARRMTSLGGRKVLSDAGERMRDAWLRFADVGAPPRVVAALLRTRTPDARSSRTTIVSSRTRGPPVVVPGPRCSRFRDPAQRRNHLFSSRPPVLGGPTRMDSARRGGFDRGEGGSGVTERRRHDRARLLLHLGEVLGAAQRTRRRACRRPPCPTGVPRTTRSRSSP